MIHALNSKIIKSDSIYYPDSNLNFLMWTLSMYVLAQSETETANKINFDEVATYSKDGGKYIAMASIKDPTLPKSKLYDSMKNWQGPMWSDNGCILLWQINNKWCERAVEYNTYVRNIEQDMKLLYRFITNEDL